MPIRCVLIMCAVLPIGAWAHDGPHHVIERLTAALQREPQRVDLLIERAFQHRIAEHGAAALADLDRAHTLDPINPRIVLHRGHVLVLLGRHAEADQAFSTFLATNPAHAAALAARARVRVALGQPDAAIADYNQALQTVDDVDWYLERGQLQEAAGRLSDAARGYTRGMDRLNGGVALRQALIRVHTGLGRYDAALTLIDQAERQATAKTPWRLRRAEVLQAAGRSIEARAALQQALVEARRVLALRHTPMNLYQKARVHLALDDWSAARRDLQAALQAAPRFQKAQTLLRELERRPAHDASHQERAHADPANLQ